MKYLFFVSDADSVVPIHVVSHVAIVQERLIFGRRSDIGAISRNRGKEVRFVVDVGVWDERVGMKFFEVETKFFGEEAKVVHTFALVTFGVFVVFFRVVDHRDQRDGLRFLGPRALYNGLNG